MITREKLLSVLPPYRDEWVIVKDDQDVKDIIKCVLEYHKRFAGDYDKIVEYFYDEDRKQFSKNIYDFLKKNIRYKEESDDDQTTALPGGYLTRGTGDCKHFSGFSAGLIDAANRKYGKKIKWLYRFASYDLMNTTPHHVFVVVFDEDGREMWIDPTPNVKGKFPIWQNDYKVDTMALRANIAGIGDVMLDSLNDITEDQLQEAVKAVNPEMDMTKEQYDAIMLLYSKGVIDYEGNVNKEVYDSVRHIVDVENAFDVFENYLKNHAAKVSGLFDDIWGGVKTATLAVPRNAFLGLVALNVFGYASKLNKAWADLENRDKLWKKWESLGGKGSALENAIYSGAKKKAILGSVSNSVGAAPAAAAPAWLAIAGGIIAAIMPLVIKLLQDKNQYQEFQNFDNQLPPGSNGTGGNFIQNNPVVVGAALLLIGWYFLSDNK